MSGNRLYAKLFAGLGGLMLLLAASGGEDFQHWQVPLYILGAFWLICAAICVAALANGAARRDHEKWRKGR